MSVGVVAAAVSAAVRVRDWKARPLLRIRYGGQWSEWSSHIEGKAAREAVSERGQGANFN